WRRVGAFFRSQRPIRGLVSQPSKHVIRRAGWVAASVQEVLAMAILCFRIRDIDYYPQSEWDLGSVLAKRRALMCNEPIISSAITRLDLWLCDQPELTLQEIEDIWTRMMIVSSLMYELEKDSEQRHTILVAVREHFDEFKKLPEKWQERVRRGLVGFAN